MDAPTSERKPTSQGGQGLPELLLNSRAQIYLVWSAVNMELARIEANFSGLSPGKHGWSINEFGDLTKGAASTGKVYNQLLKESAEEPLGDLVTSDANDKGEAFSRVSEKPESLI